jgi:hypothetical protein
MAEPSAGIKKFSVSFTNFRKPELGNFAFLGLC